MPTEESIVRLKTLQAESFGPQFGLPNANPVGLGGEPIGSAKAMVRCDVLSVSLVGEGVAKLNIASSRPRRQRENASKKRGLNAPDFEVDFFCMALFVTVLALEGWRRNYFRSSLMHVVDLHQTYPGGVIFAGQNGGVIARHERHEND